MNNFFENIHTNLGDTTDVDLFFEVWGASRNIASTNKVDGIGVSLGTHPGLKRTRNEDRVVSALVSAANGRDYFVAILCDGVGGSEFGDIAATLTISAIISDISQEKSDRALNDILCDSVKKADRVVADLLLGKGATTACVFLASTREMVAVSIGDSRIFSWDHRNNIINQISEDDTLENELRKINKNDMSALNAYGLRGRLSQAIGENSRASDELKLNVISHTELLNGYGLILASDGAWKDTNQCFDEVIKNAPSAVDAVRRILAIATWCGGSDNISILAIDNLKDIEALLISHGASSKTKSSKVSLWQVDKKSIVHVKTDSTTSASNTSIASTTKTDNKKTEAINKKQNRKSSISKRHSEKNKDNKANSDGFLNKIEAFSDNENSKNKAEFIYSNDPLNKISKNDVNLDIRKDGDKLQENIPIKSKASDGDKEELKFFEKKTNNIQVFSNEKNSDKDKK
jgi:serine/threonine protein phosphatase PrpC